ncbi:MAG: class I SAM-dependent methyltransferase, partial [Acidobacteriota bacterium]
MNNDHFIRPEALWKEVGLRAEQTVVHLGSGAGFYIIPAAKIVGSHGRAIAIDIRSDMLTEVENRARQKGVENVKTMRANLENKPGSDLPDNTADWVLVANILHQSDPQRILREAHRVCAMNGHIVVVEWNT